MRRYETDDPHGECIEDERHEDTPEAREQCEVERDEARAERALAIREDLR
jgi:hypothetical protein